MKRSFSLFVTIFAIALCTDAGAGTFDSDGTVPGDRGIRFTENRGQIADTRGDVRNDIRFVAEGAGARLYFTDRGVSYVFADSDPATAATEPAQDGFAKAAPRETRMHRMDMELVGANPFPRIRFEDELPGYSNYYLAHCPDGVTHVKSYSTVVYEDVYDNIDLVFMSREGRLKYEYRVRPGGRPSDIAMRYSGASRLALLPGGAMEVHSPLGYIEEAQPYTYEDNGREVRSSYRLRDDVLTFDVDRYSATRTLVIDPWSTYFGGSDFDVATDVATDTYNNVYVTGQTASDNFPLSSGAVQSTRRGALDLFIAKFDSYGTLQWATYYGGSLQEFSAQSAVDDFANVYFGGATVSTDFPVTANAFQNVAPGGGDDAVLVKLDMNGTRLWATYVGGKKEDEIWDVSVDNENNVVHTGLTNSNNFPTTTGAFQTGLASGNAYDTFISKFNASGMPVWTTLYGGKDDDVGRGIAVDAANNVIASGRTVSNNFPVTSGAFQSSKTGSGWDAYIIKFTSTGTRSWATYLGGSDNEGGKVLVSTLANGNIAVGGWTSSLDFPVSSGAFQQSYGGGGIDAYICMFTDAGAILWSTYCGGKDYEFPGDFSMDGGNNLLLISQTYSSDMPVSTGAFQMSKAGGTDAYVTKFDASGNQIWGTYFGGSATERAEAIAADANGNVIIAGGTASTDFPILGAYQSTLNNIGDAFVAQLDPNGQLPGYNQPPVAVASATPASGTVPLTVQFSSAGSNDPDGTITSWYWDFGDGNSATMANPSHMYTNAGTYDATLTVTDDGNLSASASVTVTPYSTSGIVYASAMTVSRIVINKNFDYGEAEITVSNNSSQPVSGAAVTASYTGYSSGTVSGITDASGTVILQTPKGYRSSAPWCFTVSDIQAAGYTYQSAANLVGEVCDNMPKYSNAVAGELQLRVSPNPLSQQAQVSFTLPEAVEVMLIVYDAVGREVATLTEGSYPAGTHTAVFTADGLPRGTYFCRMYAGRKITTSKILLK